MTDNKTDVPCPIRTLAVRSDGTIVRGLAATPTEARRWLEAVQTHGRRTALAQVALAATTPATPGEGDKGTTVSARNWRVVTDWTTPGAETYDPRGLEETPPGSRTVIIDQQGGLHELTAPADPRAGQQPQDVSGIPRRPRNGRETPPGRRPRGPRGTALDRSATQPDGRDGTDRRR